MKEKSSAKGPFSLEFSRRKPLALFIGVVYVFLLLEPIHHGIWISR